MKRIKNIKLNDGTPIHLKIYGEGFPLLLLHGNGGSMKFFSKQIRALKKECCVICMDTRGHGRSGKTGEEFDFEVLADDVFQVLSVLHIDQADILGFSDGANIALVFAKNHPQMVKKLILNSPNEKLKQVKWIHRVSNYIQYYSAKLASLFVPKFRNSLSVYRLLFEEIDIEDDDYANFTFPTLIIAGENDCLFLETYKKLSEKIKDSQVVIIKGHGHNVARTNPKEFNQAILKFLR